MQVRSVFKIAIVMLGLGIGLGQQALSPAAASADEEGDTIQLCATLTRSGHPLASQHVFVDLNVDCVDGNGDLYTRKTLDNWRGADTDGQGRACLQLKGFFAAYLNAADGTCRKRLYAVAVAGQDRVCARITRFENPLEVRSDLDQDHRYNETGSTDPYCSGYEYQASPAQ